VENSKRSTQFSGKKVPLYSWLYLCKMLSNFQNSKQAIVYLKGKLFANNTSDELATLHSISAEQLHLPTN